MLAKHLRAIQEQNLEALADTVARDALVLIKADAKLVRSAAQFLEAHRGWFATQNWTLGVRRLDYREPPSMRSESYLMVQDQNTPSK